MIGDFKMKKSILIIIMAAVLVTFVGCNKTDEVKPNSSQPAPSQETPNTNEDENNTSDVQSEITLEETINKIYDVKKPELSLGEIPVDLANADSVKSFTGLTDTSKVKDVAASEAMIGSQAYSLVLIQVKDATDAKGVAEQVLNGIDQRKWICVEADDMQVVAQGDVIMMFMVSSELSETVTSAQIVDAFKQVRGGKLDIELKK